MCKYLFKKQGIKNTIKPVVIIFFDFFLFFSVIFLVKCVPADNKSLRFDCVEGDYSTYTKL